jgi:hypothetical protein
MKKLMFVLVLLALLVVPSTAMAEEPSNVWYVPGNFATIQEAIDSVMVANGDTIFVGPGNHAGALVTKAVQIKGEDGAVINSGPMHPAGLSQGFRLLAGSDGATLSHLTFEVDLVIMNGDAVNDVTVTQCRFNNAIQAVSNWRGSGWEISHNEISDLRTRCGGGIGILIGDYLATPQGVKDNVVSHNKITGVLHVAPGDCGGYAGTGIVLYADFRGGMPGAEEITNNHVVQNKISLTSDTPDVVPVWAIELTDTRNDSSLDSVVFGNAIGFNDLRGTDNAFALTPESLANVNDISRNLGDNRGHGLHPSVFGPGG